ncbi:MAG: N-acetylmuramoyl-L-alanine amidase [Verrucomicrobia subdivision 3 bacterium]|nr:N-acetylmuramoyl-L-alanine amidase [Limisphaerales bacterium]
MVRAPLRKILIVYRVPSFLAGGIIALYLGGCQTGVQHRTAIPTQAVAPDLEVAPAANVELVPLPPSAAVARSDSTIQRFNDSTIQRKQSQTAWPSNWVNTWVSLQSWSKFNNAGPLLRTMSNPHLAFQVALSGRPLSLKIGSRVANYDGLECWLGYAPQMIGGEAYVHWLDAQKTLQPLLAPPDFWFDKAMPTIVIDAGHGGADIGTTCVNGGCYEKEYTLDWARRLGRILATNGWNVVLTRSGDVELGLAERVAVAERVNADFFLSLHFNSGASNRDTSGIETYCLTPTGMPSNLTRSYEDDLRQAYPNNAFDEQNFQAAVRLHRVLVKATGAADRGVRRARFMGVLRGQNRPAVLIEGGYLSNPTEAQRIASGAYRQTLAEALARGLQVAR